MGNKVSFAERTDSQYHRSHIIVYYADTTMFHFAEFKNVDQLNFFIDTLGISLTAIRWYESERMGIVREYSLSHNLVSKLFKSADDLPIGCKPIKALSNGSIVTCYYLNDGENVTFYRPNPNYPAIYKPLTTPQHIAHQSIYGEY